VCAGVILLSPGNGTEEEKELVFGHGAAFGTFFSQTT
jgi:hypothetical protein